MDNIGKRVVSDDVINQVIGSDVPKLVRLLWRMDEYIANANGYRLTRIRPNNCAFKDAFFGSNPLEVNSGAVKIGAHARDFTRCGETEQSETARSGLRSTLFQGVKTLIFLTRPPQFDP
jgi:hypothetical protein